MENHAQLRETAGHFRNLARTCNDGYAALSYAQLADQIEFQLLAGEKRTLFNPDGLSGLSASRRY
jgi:hypothetical protein